MSFLRAIKGNPKGLTGAIISTAIILGALFAPIITPYDPNDQNRAARLSAPIGIENYLPNHILGTDGLGRDLLSRIVYGARISLVVALSAATVSLLIGLVLGLLSGYLRGFVDLAITRLVEMQLAFPFLLLAITLLAITEPVSY